MELYAFEHTQVTVFSDPMVDVLTSISNSGNKNYFKGGKRGQYIPISGKFFEVFYTFLLCYWM